MKSKISYTLLDPTGNITILVRTPVIPELQPKIAAAIMKTERTAEQTGFITSCSLKAVHMRMAGGEFCGNAAMSAAVTAASEFGVDRADIPVIFAGIDISVNVRVKKKEHEAWDGTVEMPQPESIKEVDFPDGGKMTAVFLKGITHVISEESISKEKAELLCREWCGFLKSDALGIMQYERAGQRLTPLVYVPSADTLFWENSCASGTAALGYFLDRKYDLTTGISVHEPGGILRIKMNGSGRIDLSGTVRIFYTKETEIDI